MLVTSYPIKASLFSIYETEGELITVYSHFELMVNKENGSLDKVWKNVVDLVNKGIVMRCAFYKGGVINVSR